jgi:hypothetical protein
VNSYRPTEILLHDLEILLGTAILLSAVDSVLLAVLATVYGKTAIRTRAAYPLGLLIFSVLLLVQSAGTALGYFFASPYLGDQAYPFMSIVGGFELAGLIVLLRITL